MEIVSMFGSENIIENDIFTPPTAVVCKRPLVEARAVSSPQKRPRAEEFIGNMLEYNFL